MPDVARTQQAKADERGLLSPKHPPPFLTVVGKCVFNREKKNTFTLTLKLSASSQQGLYFHLQASFRKNVIPSDPSLFPFYGQLLCLQMCCDAKIHDEQC